MPRCLNCKEKFEKKYPNQMGKFRYCLLKDDCIKAFNNARKKHQELQRKKAWRKEKKKLSEKLKTHKDWLKDLQKVFNTFIRLRDKNQPCISCRTNKKNIQYAAGHYYPMGNYSFLRFHEDNVHKQCNMNCNMKLSGNLIEYRKHLLKKIGKDRLQWLEDNRHNELKLSIPEIKEKIKHYKQKIKDIES